MIHFRLLISGLVLALVLAGCTQMKNGVFPKKDVSAVPAAKDIFQSAMQAFQAAEYDTARKEFQTVLDSATDPVIARKARFGVACSAMAGATNEAELKQAQQLFEEWALKAPSELKSEDPRLLYPVLKDYYLLTTTTILELREHCQDLRKQNSRLNQEKKALQDQCESLEDQCAGLAEENAKLQQKLEALEKLHDELREMRQGTEK